MNKYQLPEVVGFDAEEAKAIILSHDPNISAEFVPEGSMVTCDFREDRVRVFHNDANKVFSSPKRKLILKTNQYPLQQFTLFFSTYWAKRSSFIQINLYFLNGSY